MALTHAVAGTERFTRPASAEWVVFRCADRWLSVPLSRTREILMPQPCTRLPGCGPAVLGLVGLRGRVVTAFDLGAALGTGRSSESGPDHRLLLLEHGARLVAAAVDDVVAVADGGLTPLPADAADLEMLSLEADDVLGVGVLAGESFLALDSDRILGRLVV